MHTGGGDSATVRGPNPQNGTSQVVAAGKWMKHNGLVIFCLTRGESRVAARMSAES